MAEEGREIVEEGDFMAGEEKEIVEESTEDSTEETKVRTSEEPQRKSSKSTPLRSMCVASVVPLWRHCGSRESGNSHS